MVVVNCRDFGNGTPSILTSIHHYYTGVAQILVILRSNGEE